jgi:16S rRNA (adenine1518-N6/adenine1519-N6)-dimethyltransferase
MNHRPRKRFGQHFLHDPAVLARIAAAFAPDPADHVIEIGPGEGALTRLIAGRVGRFEAVEIDRDLVQALRAAFPPAVLTVHEADALEFDYCAAAAASGRRLRLLGNLPYNISTPLLFRLIECAACIEDMLFMLQKEVVDRLAAAPGGKDYGRLSVMVQWRLAVERLFDVGPGAFRPPPKVSSSVVRLTPHAVPPVTVREPARFAALVQAAFGKRRKTLRNALAGIVPEAAFGLAGLDPDRRAETLTVTEFAALTEAAAKTEGELPARFGLDAGS